MATHGRARTSLDAFLQDNPEITYQAMRPQTASRSFTDYWRTRFGTAQGDYFGSIGKTAIEGEVPRNQYFQDFLGKYPWTSYWEGLSPSAKGQRPSMYAPRMQWNMRR